ncbi:MAG: flavin reductase family protein [Deltaproteobacteria bacterium]
MFYEPKNGHGLPHNPFSAIVAPRPIGWISTRDSSGQDNLAPYSFFNAVAYDPPQLMFASTGVKHSLTNIRETGVFCVNIVGQAQFAAMSLTSGSYPKEVDEFERASIAKAECEEIDCPRVADAPAALECKMTEIITLAGIANFMVLGEVIGVHLRDDCLVDGRFDATIWKPVARMGYQDYALPETFVTQKRPGE